MTGAPEAFAPGVRVDLAPFVSRVVAPNPGVMTGPGTNTYLVGRDRLAVIDPGPDDLRQRDAIVAAAGGRPIDWILTTHTHPDHAPGTAALKAVTGASAHGFAARDGFEPDSTLADGDEIGTGEGFPLQAVHTPGHASNHLCYLQPEFDLLFSGDHVMSGSTVVISPPDGDMAAYLRSLRRVRGLGLRSIAPGHGGLIGDPDQVLGNYIAHRLDREQRVAHALGLAGQSTVDDLVPTVYADVEAARHPIARFSLWAHLRKLHEDGRITAANPDDITTEWQIA